MCVSHWTCFRSLPRPGERTGNLLLACLSWVFLCLCDVVGVRCTGLRTELPHCRLRGPLPISSSQPLAGLCGSAAPVLARMCQSMSPLRNDGLCLYARVQLAIHFFPRSQAASLSVAAQPHLAPRTDAEGGGNVKLTRSIYIYIYIYVCMHVCMHACMRIRTVRKLTDRGKSPNYRTCPL